MSSAMRPSNLRCEYLVDPVGIDVREPRLSWTIESELSNQRQIAFQIVVWSGERAIADERERIWDTGRVEKGGTIGHAYAGPPVRSRERYWWAVRAWDHQGEASEFSEPAAWEMGLLEASDWRGAWISLPGFTERPQKPDIPTGTLRDLSELDLPPAPLLRREFDLALPVRRARLYATARGVYELSINGLRVSDQVLAPGWTDYNKRIQYQTYDVTGLLRAGQNSVGAQLGTGWYAGYIGPYGENKHYGLKPSLLVQLIVEHEDGSVSTLATDDSWRATTGPIVYSDFLAGESYDAREEIEGWDLAGFDDRAWNPVETTALDETPLVADRSEPVRVIAELEPKTIDRRSDGSIMVDLGQNMVGWVRVRLSGPHGSTVRLRFTERLNRDGSFYSESLRSAHQSDFYTLRGGQSEEFEPHFTFHGFQYVELTGLADEITLESVTGVVVGSDLEKSGHFETSDSMVDQLQRNILWGQRGNFLSIPTDCPQRDERLGWLGDAQVFVRTSCFNADAAAFWTKWLVDVDDARSPEGAYSNVAPRLVVMQDGAPAWGNAGVIIPWTIYQVYGDRRLLEQHYAAMAAWVDYLLAANPDLLWVNLRTRDYGDWLAIGETTSKEMIGTAFFAHDADLMSKIAAVIGRESDVARYRDLFVRIKARFVEAYVSDDGAMLDDTQTGYCLALAFDLLPEEMRAGAARRLVANIERNNWHLTTGFVGVSHLCPVLTRAGYSDVAYRLLHNRDFPSWGYMIERGATTMWERWDGWTEENGFQTPRMNSFNHYAFGAIGDWLYRYVAGIDTDPDLPGYARIVIRPYPGGLDRVSATYRSIRGEIKSEWTHQGTDFNLQIVVPANTTAVVHVPGADATSEDGNEPDAGFQEPGRSSFTVGSGEHRYRSMLSRDSAFAR
jgi:alpha-L-rhamnosidase